MKETKEQGKNKGTRGRGRAFLLSFYVINREMGVRPVTLQGSSPPLRLQRVGSVNVFFMFPSSSFQVNVSPQKVMYPCQLFSLGRDTEPGFI